MHERVHISCELMSSSRGLQHFYRMCCHSLPQSTLLLMPALIFVARTVKYPPSVLSEL